MLLQLQAWSIAEMIAVIAAIAYLLLAVRQHIACWLFAAISTSIYIGLFLQVKLYMEAVLNAFYLVMAVYGWMQWRKGSAGGSERPVTRKSLRYHGTAILLVSALALSNGYVLQLMTDAAFPYIDSSTTWFAIWATFLMAKKYLENWWYWLVIDVASIAIFWQRDLQLTALLYCVYVAIIPIGYMSWKRTMYRPGAAV